MGHHSVRSMASFGQPEPSIFFMMPRHYFRDGPAEAELIQDVVDRLCVGLAEPVFQRSQPGRT
jgi:hypothetical protein